MVGKFFLTPELDFDRSRIINAERAKNNRTVLFIGQFGQVEKTLDILKYCSSFNDVDILFYSTLLIKLLGMRNTLK
ncbi:hypothetical protein Y011_21185 [Vibrio parahaemolyticus VP49]|nr:hypothetical protein Y011_21185 [Vibrio parahaemolyticus VP49]